MKNHLIYFISRVMGTASFTRRLEWRHVMAWLEPRKGEKILDIACGMGELSLRIAKKSGQVYGIDMSEDAVRFARWHSERAKIPCQFKVGDAEWLPYPDGYFDKIICSSSLEHFEDDNRALKEMRRVLKEKGRAVLTVDSFTLPISDELKDRHRQTCFVVHYYTRETLGKCFRGCGLDMCRSQYLIKSSLASFFFKLWIKYRKPAILWLAVSFFGHPLFLISEKLAGRRDGGYTLIAEAVKAD